MASVFEGLSLLIQYDLIIAFGAVLLALVGGILQGVSHRIPDRSGMYLWGMSLFALSGATTVLLSILFFVNLFAGVAVSAVLAMAAAWMGASTGTGVVGAIAHSLIAVGIALAGMIAGAILAWLINRKITKRQ